MEIKSLSQVIALGMTVTLVTAQAAPPVVLPSARMPAAARVIGTVVTSGTLLMNERPVPGSGTVQEGSALATNGAPSTLHLGGGVRLDLAPFSRGRFYQDHMILEKGEATVQGNYRLDTNELRISPDAGARSAVAYETDGRLQVSAAAGTVRVASHQGLLLASVRPGQSVLLSPKANNAPDTMSLVGTIEKRESGLFLQDETAGITVRLQGRELTKFIGKKVRVSGRTDEQAPRLEGVAATINVASVQPMGAAARRAGKAGAAAGGAAAGAGLSTTAAVVGGIAVAGAVTGTAVAVSRSGRSATGSGTLGPQTISQ